jgi:hypothetical protein
MIYCHRDGRELCPLLERPSFERLLARLLAQMQDRSYPKEQDESFKGTVRGPRT